MNEDSFPSQQELTTLVYENAYMMNVFSREQFDLPDDWVPQIKLDFKDTTGRSFGGVDSMNRPSMTLYLGVLQKYRPHGFPEYARYSKHKRIGNVASSDWRVYVTTLMAHEYSHVVQFSLNGRSNKLALASPNAFQGLGNWSGDHGDFFKNIYVQFRDEFVNTLVDKEALGAPVAKISIRHEHEWLGKFYQSPKFGKLQIITYQPRARIWKFIVQCPITETLYKTTEERIRNALRNT
jgi:hypothetical protein